MSEDVKIAADGAAAARPAREMSGARERPYDMRWGTPRQVGSQFGINAATLKAAWKRGWVRARQGNWKDDGMRTQTVYCFEDVHVFLERVAHKVSDGYAEKWWTDEAVQKLEGKFPVGPHQRDKERGEESPRTGRREAPDFGFGGLTVIFVNEKQGDKKQ